MLEVKKGSIEGYGNVYFTEGGINLKNKDEKMGFRILEKYKFDDNKSLYKKVVGDEYLAFVLDADGMVYMIDAENLPKSDDSVDLDNQNRTKVDF